MSFRISILNALMMWGIFSCSVPDLSDPKILAEAKKDAVELNSLQRKFMYDMFYLYLDKEGKPFTGWVKKSNQNGLISELGYLKTGRKEGQWITWDLNQSKISEIEWSEDRMEGKFFVWYSHGQIKVIGQTTDGEVDGQWKEYYKNGNLACRSINRVGHLIEIEVWKPSGELCELSRVSNGNGTFVRYLDDGRIEHQRQFKKGVEKSRKIVNQR